MKFRTFLAASVLVSSLIAQESIEAPRAPACPTRVHAGGIEIDLVGDNPFSARYSIELSRVLENGSIQSTQFETTVARDSNGRIFRERRNNATSNPSAPSSVANIFILDPVARTSTNCEVASRHCILTRYRAPALLRPVPDGSFDPGNRFVSSENLGNDVIEGLSVVGTRETDTYRGPWPAEKSERKVLESWYAPDLGVNLSATSKDSRGSNESLHVVELSRSEPDAALFQIPSGFTVDDIRQKPKPQN